MFIVHGTIVILSCIDLTRLEWVDTIKHSRLSLLFCPRGARWPAASNYWQRLKALNLMSLQRRRERYIPSSTCGLWKVLYGKCPNDVNIQFSVTLRHGQKAVIPTLNRSSSQRDHTTICLQLLDLDCGT